MVLSEKKIDVYLAGVLKILNMRNGLKQNRQKTIQANTPTEAIASITISADYRERAGRGERVNGSDRRINGKRAKVVMGIDQHVKKGECIIS